jgi:hypothetical protein
MTRVYLHGSPTKPPVEEHHVIVCPGGHLAGVQLDSSFFTIGKDGPVPKQIPIVFRFGESEEISDALARYMVDFGMAEKPPRPRTREVW